MPLTTLQIKASEPSLKPYKLFDQEGLFLLVMPAGGKYWRFDYRYGGKRKTLALGAWPLTGLKEARERLASARNQLATGADPGLARKIARLTRIGSETDTFETVAREWLGARETEIAEVTHFETKRRLERDVFPWIGELPITNIGAPELLVIIKRVDQRGRRYTAKRVLSEMSRVFRYAVATGRVLRDPCPDLRDAIPSRKPTHHAAVTQPKDVAALLRAIDAFEGSFTVQSALRMSAYVFVRPGELRKAKWADIDLEAKLWRIPAEVMKMREPHVVPLATQVVAILEELKPVSGHLEYVFKGGWDPLKPMSEAAVNAALRRLGYDTQTEMTGHGFRAMARTILEEQLDYDHSVIELQLAHKTPGALGATYNRARHMAKRASMMQEWADYLDKLKFSKPQISENR